MAKLDALIEQAGLVAGHEVLEIGFGWGSLAIRAVQACQIHIEVFSVQKQFGSQHCVTVMPCKFGCRCMGRTLSRWLISSLMI